MGRSKKTGAGGGKDLDIIQRQLEELKLKQEQAMAAVLKAQQEMQQKEAETQRSMRELEKAEAEKERAGAQADFHAKTASGDEQAKMLAVALQRELSAAVG